MAGVGEAADGVGAEPAGEGGARDSASWEDTGGWYWPGVLISSKPVLDDTVF